MKLFFIKFSYNKSERKYFYPTLLKCFKQFDRAFKGNASEFDKIFPGKELENKGLNQLIFAQQN